MESAIAPVAWLVNAQTRTSGVLVGTPLAGFGETGAVVVPTLPAHAFSAAPMHSSQTFWSLRTFGGVNRSFQFFKQPIVFPFFPTYGFPIFAVVIVRWRIHFLTPLIARVAEMAQETTPVTHRVQPVCCDKLNTTLWIPGPTVARVRTTLKSHRRVPMRFLAGKAKHLAAVPRLLLQRRSRDHTLPTTSPESRPMSGTGRGILRESGRGSRDRSTPSEI